MYAFLGFSDKTLMDTKSKAIKQLKAMINIQYFQVVGAVLFSFVRERPRLTEFLKLPQIDAILNCSLFFWTNEEVKLLEDEETLQPLIGFYH